MLLKHQDQLLLCVQGATSEGNNVQMNLKSQEHFHDPLITSGQAQRYSLLAPQWK